MMRLAVWAAFAVLLGILSVPQLATAQELTPEQKDWILQRFPQIDRNGDGKLSPKKSLPSASVLRKLSKREKSKPAPTAAKGPVPTHADLQYGDHKNAVMDVWIADSEKPTPIVVAIHGGGFKSGDKSKFHGCAELQACPEKWCLVRLDQLSVP